MTSSPAAERRERILRAAVRERLLDPDHAVLAAFVDLDAVAASVEALHRAFPPSVQALHTAAYVEYTKTSGGRPIAITHAGAQVATRTVFMPEAWPLRITAHDPTGSLKGGEAVPQDIAGPCCFAGDLLAQARPLPQLAPGDIVTLLDTGAYYSSTPFHYNSLPDPAVHGVRIAADGTIRFRLLRPAETIRHVLARTGGAVLGAG